LSAELTKTHSSRLFFCRFCPLGYVNPKIERVILRKI